MLFLRRESWRQYLHAYPITSVLIIAITISMILSSLISFFIGSRLIYELGGMVKEDVLDGQIYRLWSYAFLHSGFEHFIFNVFFIYLIAPPVEKMLGKVKFILFFVVTVLFSALMIMMVGKGVSVGASGFGYGLFGFYLYLILLRPNFLDYHSRTVILLFIVIGWAITFLFPNVSFAGHFGGFVSGFAFAYMTGKSLKRPIIY
ncbi:MAG: rhomboid family intramembrane serine protease [Bacillaceae bacterium]|nr:rhomboid family intramembrane serine protease [Bacillaceae bacterium]